MPSIVKKYTSSASLIDFNLAFQCISQLVVIFLTFSTKNISSKKILSYKHTYIFSTIKTFSFLSQLRYLSISLYQSLVADVGDA